jgi:hypothetical protein
MLRHINKKRFSVFSRFLRICNHSLQKVQIRAKKIILLKNSIWVSKNAEFHADFESVVKVLKKCTKKVIGKNMTEICAFSHLIMFVRLVLLITFFGATFYNFFNGFKISVKFCVF